MSADTNPIVPSTSQTRKPQTVTRPQCSERDLIIASHLEDDITQSSKSAGDRALLEHTSTYQNNNHDNSCSSRPAGKFSGNQTDFTHTTRPETPAHESEPSTDTDEDSEEEQRWLEMAKKTGLQLKDVRSIVKELVTNKDVINYAIRQSKRMKRQIPKKRSKRNRSTGFATYAYCASDKSNPLKNHRKLEQLESEKDKNEIENENACNTSPLIDSIIKKREDGIDDNGDVEDDFGDDDDNEDQESSNGEINSSDYNYDDDDVLSLPVLTRAQKLEILRSKYNIDPLTACPSVYNLDRPKPANIISKHATPSADHRSEKLPQTSSKETGNKHISTKQNSKLAKKSLSSISTSFMQSVSQTMQTCKQPQPIPLMQSPISSKVRLAHGSDSRQDHTAVRNNLKDRKNGQSGCIQSPDNDDDNEERDNDDDDDDDENDRDYIAEDEDDNDNPHSTDTASQTETSDALQTDLGDVQSSTCQQKLFCLVCERNTVIGDRCLHCHAYREDIFASAELMPPLNFPYSPTPQALSQFNHLPNIDVCSSSIQQEPGLCLAEVTGNDQNRQKNLLPPEVPTSINTSLSMTKLSTHDLRLPQPNSDAMIATRTRSKYSLLDKSLDDLEIPLGTSTKLFSTRSTEGFDSDDDTSWLRILYADPKSADDEDDADFQFSLDQLANLDAFEEEERQRLIVPQKETLALRRDTEAFFKEMGTQLDSVLLVSPRRYQMCQSISHHDDRSSRVLQPQLDVDTTVISSSVGDSIPTALPKFHEDAPIDSFIPKDLVETQNQKTESDVNGGAHTSGEKPRRRSKPCLQTISRWTQVARLPPKSNYSFTETQLLQLYSQMQQLHQLLLQCMYHTILNVHATTFEKLSNLHEQLLQSSAETDQRIRKMSMHKVPGLYDLHSALNEMKQQREILQKTDIPERLDLLAARRNCANILKPLHKYFQQELNTRRPTICERVAKAAHERRKQITREESRLLALALMQHGGSVAQAQSVYMIMWTQSQLKRHISNMAVHDGNPIGALFHGISPRQFRKLHLQWHIPIRGKSSNRKKNTHTPSTNKPERQPQNFEDLTQSKIISKTSNTADAMKNKETIAQKHLVKSTPQEVKPKPSLSAVDTPNNQNQLTNQSLQSGKVESNSQYQPRTQSVSSPIFSQLKADHVISQTSQSLPPSPGVPFNPNEQIPRTKSKKRRIVPVPVQKSPPKFQLNIQAKSSQLAPTNEPVQSGISSIGSSRNSLSETVSFPGQRQETLFDLPTSATDLPVHRHPIVTKQDTIFGTSLSMWLPATSLDVNQVNPSACSTSNNGTASKKPKSLESGLFPTSNSNTTLLTGDGSGTEARLFGHISQMAVTDNSHLLPSIESTSTNPSMPLMSALDGNLLETKSFSSVLSPRKSPRFASLSRSLFSKTAITSSSMLEDAQLYGSVIPRIYSPINKHSNNSLFLSHFSDSRLGFPRIPSGELSLTSEILAPSTFMGDSNFNWPSWDITASPQSKKRPFQGILTHRSKDDVLVEVTPSTFQETNDELFGITSNEKKTLTQPKADILEQVEVKPDIVVSRDGKELHRVRPSCPRDILPSSSAMMHTFVPMTPPKKAHIVHDPVASEPEILQNANNPRAEQGKEKLELKGLSVLNRFEPSTTENTSSFQNSPIAALMAASLCRNAKTDTSALSTKPLSIVDTEYAGTTLKNEAQTESASTAPTQVKTVTPMRKRKPVRPVKRWEYDDSSAHRKSPECVPQEISSPSPSPARRLNSQQVSRPWRREEDKMVLVTGKRIAAGKTSWISSVENSKLSGRTEEELQERFSFLIQQWKRRRSSQF